MHNIISEKPYQFFPPTTGSILPFIFRQFAGLRLNRSFGVVKVNCRGLDKLKASLDAKVGILLAPNHSHPADPFVLIELGRQLGFSPFIMASSHLFIKNKFNTWLLQNGRIFSVYREGLDRQALSQAIEILEQAKAPLVIFPEGVISRHNSRLNPLMDGVSLIANSAAKKRAKLKPPGDVVVHPVILDYQFAGDVNKVIPQTLSEIELRLSWRTQDQHSILDRIYKIGDALLTLKELEYIGLPQSGTLPNRLQGLINFLLEPLEKEWVNGRSDGGTVARVKRLRAAVLPDIVQGNISEEERSRRWRQLEEMYLSQQIHCYAPDYLKENPSAERILETVERFEEDLTDLCRIYRPRVVNVIVGDAIVVAPSNKGVDKKESLTDTLSQCLTNMISKDKQPVS